MAAEQSNTVKALQTAIQMEVDGKEFYLKAGRASANELGQTLFKTLAGEEDLHLKRFEQIYETIEKRKQWPQVEIPPHPLDLKTVFSEASEHVHATGAELEALQTAMVMENKTYDFYTRQSETAGFPAEKDYYQRLAGEERAHHAYLMDYHEYLTNPGQYFTLKERHSLDGG